MTTTASSYLTFVDGAPPEEVNGYAHTKSADGLVTYTWVDAQGRITETVSYPIARIKIVTNTLTHED